jgi:hypothetical protein
VPEADTILDLTLPELVAARGLGLAAVLRDLQASADAVAELTVKVENARRATADATEKSGEDNELEILEEDLSRLRNDLAARRAQAAERLEALSCWPEGQRLLPGLALVSTEDPASGLALLEDALAGMGKEQQGDRHTWVLLESLASTELPKKTRWVLGKTESFVPTFIRYQAQMGAADATLLIDELATLHRRAGKRIAKDATPPGMQATVGVLSLAIAVTVPGSDVVGSFIGEHFMGLHGAAATSAGLAALGGGSLASGGFGMAGGAIVAGSLMKGVEYTTKRVVLAKMIAGVSSEAFICELASLDVRCRLDPERQPEIVSRLREIESVIRSEWNAVRPDPAARRRRIWNQLSSLGEDPSSFRSVVQGVRGELPKAEERNLATSVRALEYEIRHLESPEWKRVTAAVPRFLGVPIAARLIDKAESFLDDAAQQTQLSEFDSETRPVDEGGTT